MPGTFASASFLSTDKLVKRKENVRFHHLWATSKFFGELVQRSRRLVATDKSGVPRRIGQQNMSKVDRTYVKFDSLLNEKRLVERRYSGKTRDRIIVAIRCVRSDAERLQPVVDPHRGRSSHPACRHGEVPPRWLHGPRKKVSRQR